MMGVQCHLHAWIRLSKESAALLFVGHDQPTWDCLDSLSKHHDFVCTQEAYAVREVDLTSSDNSVRTIAGTGVNQYDPTPLPAPALTAYFDGVRSLALLPDESALYFTETYNQGVSMLQN